MDPALAAALEAQLSKVDKRCRAHLPVPKHLRPKDGSSPIDPYAPTMSSALGTSSSMDTTTGAGGKRGTEQLSTSNVDEARARAALEAEAEASIAREAPALKPWLERVTQSESDARAALDVINTLSSRLQVLMKVTDAVRQQSDLLSSNASALMVRKTKLELMHNSILEVLKHFEQVDDLSREVLHPMLSPYSSRFASILEEMSDLMTYFSSCQHYKSTKNYANKLSMAQHRAMMCLRDAVSTLFSTILHDLDSVHHSQPAQSAATGTDDGSSGGNLIATGAEDDDDLARKVIHLNTLFLEKIEPSHTAAFRMLESRCGSIDSDIYIQDALTAYKDARVRLLTPVLMEALHRAQENTADPHRAVTLDAFAILTTIVEEEAKLFDSLWLRDDLVSSLRSVVEELGDVLYGQYRSALLSIDDLSSLRTLVSYLRSAAPSTTRNAAVQALPGASNLSVAQLMTPVAKKMISDTQERVVFRTSMYMRNEIQSFRAQGPATQYVAHEVPSAANEQRDESGASVDSTSVTHPHVAPISVMEKCVFLLDLLHSSLSPAVFAVFAEEAVHWTLQHILRIEHSIKLLPPPSVAGAAAAVSLGRDHWSIHAKLFLVHHLLALREQLAPYEAELVVTDKDLDFAQLMQKRTFEITQSKREAKRDIEGELKTACEAVIALFDLRLSPLADSCDDSTSLKESLAEELHKLEAVITPYVAAPATRAVLLKPIRGRGAELVREKEKQPRAPTVNAAAETAATATTANIACGDGEPVATEPVADAPPRAEAKPAPEI